MNALAVGAGFVNLDAGVRGTGTKAEGFARGEVGAHFAPQGSVFGFGEASVQLGAPVSWQTGVGLRWNF